MERIEEYLEAIYDIERMEKRIAKTKDIARKLNVKPASVTEMISKLSEKGYVDYQPYRGVTLTKKGREIAEKIKSYHLIFEKFFTEFLELEEDISHEMSCKLEHVINDDVVEKLCALISESCDLCNECRFNATTLERAEDGEYVILAMPSSLNKLGLKSGDRILVKKGKIITKDGEMDVSEELRKSFLISKA